MSHITNVIKKEIREMLTPGSVISVLFMVILFACLGNLIGGEVEKSVTLPEFGLVVDEGPYLEYEYVDPTGEVIVGVWDPITLLEELYGAESYKIVIMDIPSDSPSDIIISELEDKGLSSALIMPGIEEFRACLETGDTILVDQYYMYSPTGVFGTVSSEVMTSIVSLMSHDLSKILMSIGGQDNYEFIVDPISSSKDGINTVISGEAHAGVTPSDISNTISSQTMMIPMVIMIVIMMVGSIVISSMGSEKENKTLETLLTLPIKRTSIVTGKIVAAAIVGLVYGLAYMVGMSIYVGSMTGMISSTGATIDLAAIGMSLDTMDWALIMLSMFLAIVCALGICMILGAFSKNYKSAQTMTMPLSIMAMVPMFIIMFTGWYGSGTVVQIICFAIPFSHPMMAMQSLMFGDMQLVLGGIAYMAVFAIATILITVRLYNSDILITGLGQNRFVQRLTGRK